MISLSDKLQSYFLLLDEGKGTAYERYALNKFLENLIDRLKIKSVLELPADGIMGYPGLKSLIFAKYGCDVTLVNPSEKATEEIRQLWNSFGLKATFVVGDYFKTGLLSNSYDLVWNFCVFEHINEQDRLIREMCQFTKKYILIETQNIFNIGIPIHRLYHKILGEVWGHGEIKKMDIYKINKLLKQNNLTIFEIGGTDLPPWPDINMKISERQNEKMDFADYEDEFIKYRPAVALKDMAQIANKLKTDSSQAKLPLWMNILKIWYILLEIPAPRFLKVFFSHHPYVIAKKNVD